MSNPQTSRRHPLTPILPSTHKSPLAKNLDVNTVYSCLSTFDLFRDLLDGSPHQHRKVMKDVCKNIKLKQYQYGDIVFNVGDCAEELYLCMDGEVSICIMGKLQEDPQPQLSQSVNEFTRGKNGKVAKSESLLSPIANSCLLPKEQQAEENETEVSVVEGGEGFGEAELIAGTSRAVKAVVKSPVALIGKLGAHQFAEVRSNYEQRTYDRKREMFERCPLLSALPKHKLEFIINNSKPLTVHISTNLIKQGTKANRLYLISRGQLSLWKTWKPGDTPPQ
jgi:CRP-like cAMP-binding protein